MKTEADGKRGRWKRLAIVTILSLAVIALVIYLIENTYHTGMNASARSGGGQETAVNGQLEQYKTVLLMYQGANGFYPTTEQGLSALITKPETQPKPRSWRKLLDKPILDPWQQEYFYEQPGRHNPTSYDLFSAGPDRTPHTADDIGNWDVK